MDHLRSIWADRLQYEVVTVFRLLVLDNVEQLFAVLGFGLVWVLLFAKFTLKVFPKVCGDELWLLYDSFLSEPLLKALMMDQTHWPCTLTGSDQWIVFFMIICQTDPTNSLLWILLLRSYDLHFFQRILYFFLTSSSDLSLCFISLFIWVRISLLNFWLIAHITPILIYLELFVPKWLHSYLLRDIIEFTEVIAWKHLFESVRLLLVYCLNRFVSWGHNVTDFESDSTNFNQIAFLQFVPMDYHIWLRNFFHNLP